MKNTFEFKKGILVFFVVAVIFSGFYSAVCETSKILFTFDFSSNRSDRAIGSPVRDSIDIKAANTVIATAAEIKGAVATREAVRRTESHAGQNRIRCMMLVLSLCLLSGICFFDCLPLVLSVMSIVFGCRIIVRYIHLQYGKKKSLLFPS